MSGKNYGYSSIPAARQRGWHWYGKRTVSAMYGACLSWYIVVFRSSKRWSNAGRFGGGVAPKICATAPHVLITAPITLVGCRLRYNIEWIR